MEIEKQRPQHGSNAGSFIFCRIRLKIVYKCGANNPADYLSRHPINLQSRKQEKMTEEYISFFADNSVPRAMTMVEIIKATNSDSTLKGVCAAIRLKRWDLPVVQSFKSIKDELTITTYRVILRGTIIVVPKSLQQKAIDIAHEAHLGVEKTKNLVREKIWFLQIDIMVKNTIKRCFACQAVRKANAPEPIATFIVLKI